ncbi:MAG: HEAT repeat domain-containing protein [Planctomycetota bacterium]|jgi:HEAT repeat protein
MSRVPWYEWWWANQWRFIRIPNRLQVVTGTGKEKDQAVESIMTFLKEGLKHRYFDIKASAALALGKTGETSAAKAIRPLLRARNEIVRESAILAVGMLKDGESLPHLQKILEDRRYSQRSRVHAAVAMGLLGISGGAEGLIRMMETEEGKTTGNTIEIRAASCLALGIMKHKKAVPSLIRLLESKETDPRLRAMAATALGKFESATIMLEEGEVSPGALLLASLQTTVPTPVRRSAMMALANVWYEGLGGFLIDLYRTDPDPWVKNLSLLVVAEKIINPHLKRKFQKNIRELLTGSQKDVNLANFGAVAAGLSGDSQAIPILRVQFQKARRDDTRAAAAVGLGFLKDEESIPQMLSTVRGSGSDFLKSFCCIALALIGKGDRRISTSLRAILSDPECQGGLRSSASIALAKIGDHEAVGLLLKTAERGDRRTRQLLVQSVGYFRDLGTFVPLKGIYESPRSGNDIKTLTMVTLGYIVERDTPPILQKIFLNTNYLLMFPNLQRMAKYM